MTDYSKWPSEDWIQQACINDCEVMYKSYNEWWDNHTTGISRLIRKLLIGDYVGSQITWEEYEAWEEQQ